MGAFKDLTGTIINNWKVLRLEGMHNNGSYWLCECQCANKTQKVLSLARLKKSKDCGCSKNIDLTGAKIGRWTVVKRVEDVSYMAFPRKAWVCICECGTQRNIPENKLKNNQNPNYSCGCATCYKGVQRAINNNEFVFYDTYIEIKLSSGDSAIIDIEDYNIVKDDHWGLGSDKYVVSTSGRFKRKKLHRVIMGCENDLSVIVDHIDRNRLNNQKSNLRFVTPHQNGINQSKRKDNKSGVIGVCWWDRDKNWMAQIKYNYKRYFLGYYDNFDDAVRARLEAEIKYFGIDFAPQKHLFSQYHISFPEDRGET